MNAISTSPAIPRQVGLFDWSPYDCEENPPLANTAGQCIMSGLPVKVTADKNKTSDWLDEKKLAIFFTQVLKYMGLNGMMAAFKSYFTSLTNVDNAGVFHRENYSVSLSGITIDQLCNFAEDSPYLTEAYNSILRMILSPVLIEVTKEKSKAGAIIENAFKILQGVDIDPTKKFPEQNQSLLDSPMLMIFLMSFSKDGQTEFRTILRSFFISRAKMIILKLFGEEVFKSELEHYRSLITELASASVSYLAGGFVFTRKAIAELMLPPTVLYIRTIDTVSTLKVGTGVLNVKGEQANSARFDSQGPGSFIPICVCSRFTALILEDLISKIIFKQSNIGTKFPTEHKLKHTIAYNYCVGLNDNNKIAELDKRRVEEVEYLQTEIIDQIKAYFKNLFPAASLDVSDEIGEFMQKVAALVLKMTVFDKLGAVLKFTHGAHDEASLKEYLTKAIINLNEQLLSLDKLEIDRKLHASLNEVVQKHNVNEPNCDIVDQELIEYFSREECIKTLREYEIDLANPQSYKLESIGKKTNSVAEPNDYIFLFATRTHLLCIKDHSRLQTQLSLMGHNTPTVYFVEKNKATLTNNRVRMNNDG